MIAIPIGFLMGFLGSMPIAGPISSLVFHRGMDGRFWEGWAIGLGGALAEGIYCALAVYGLGALYDRFPVFTTLTQGMRFLLPLMLGLYLLLTKRANVHDPMPVQETRYPARFPSYRLRTRQTSSDGQRRAHSRVTKS